MQRGTKIVIALVIAASVFAAVTLYAESTLRQAFQKRMLVVRAMNVVTSGAPSGTGIPADFGPHCAKAQFAQSGALILQSDVIPADATGAVYVGYDPDDTFSESNGGSDHVAVFFFRTSAPEAGIASTVDNRSLLFAMEDRNGTLFVGGTEYGVGQEFRATFTTPVSMGTDTWAVQEEYTVTSLGFTTVTVQPPQLCA
jgi:hypothetical protein